MTTRQDIKTVLSNIDASKLVLGEDKATLTVIDFVTNTDAEKQALEGRGVLVSVKEGQGTASRFLQGTAHTDKTDWEISVYCVFNPAPDVKENYPILRDAAIDEIRRVFIAYATNFSEKNHRVDDRKKGVTTILNSTIIFTKKTYT